MKLHVMILLGLAPTVAALAIAPVLGDWLQQRLGVAVTAPLSRRLKR